MKSDLPWKEHGKSEEMAESGETGVHKGGERDGGQKRRLERLAAEKTEKVVGNQAAGSHRPGLEASAQVWGKATLRQAQLCLGKVIWKQELGDLGGSRARGTEATQSREKVVGTWKSTFEYFFMLWSCGLEKTLESPLDCKEIKPVNPKGKQS